MIFSGRHQGYNCGNAFHHQFDHFWALNDVTVAVRSRFSIFFVQKIIILMLEISLAKYEVILTNRSRVSFSCSTTANFHFPPSGAIWAKNETVISHDPADQHGRFLAFITSNEHNKRKNMVFVQLLWCFYQPDPPSLVWLNCPRRLFLVIAQWMYGVLMNLRYVDIVKVGPEGDGNTSSLY